LAAVAVAGCGGSASLPTDPSPISGAIVRGTVNSRAGALGEDARALSSSGANIRVTVVGTSLSVTTDGDGRFTIEGVPAGSVTLRFQGAGADATLRIDGLADGQIVTITVEVSGSRASLVVSPTRQQRLEFSGAIEAIAAPELRVAGQRVVTNAATEIRRGGARIALAGLQVGENVKVEGVLQPDGSLLADEIKVNLVELELEGVVASIVAPRFGVAGRMVTTHAGTKWKGQGRLRSLADLRVGDRVEVKAAQQPDGSLLASEVQRKDRDDD
jgi:hypothetical protein